MALFDLNAEEIAEVQRKRVRDSTEMSNGKCVDWPACGHTDGLGCDWVSPNDNPALYFCGNPDHDYYGTYPWHEQGKGCPEDEPDAFDTTKHPYTVCDHENGECNVDNW